MKKGKKIMSLVIAGVLAIGSLTGCGNQQTDGKGSNSKTNIEIAYGVGGLGTEFLENIIKGFEKKYPEYSVSLTTSANDNTTMAMFGKEGDTVDLYLGITQYDTTHLEPIDDVLESTVKGENKTIKEKFQPSYLKLMVADDGHYYNLPRGGGILGFVYNKEIFEDAGIKQLPRTTNELTAVCSKLSQKGYKPLCHFQLGGYYNFLDEVFFSQYDGFDYFVNNFYASKDANGNSPSKELFTQKDGRYQTLKAYEKFITPEYVMEGSNSLDHTSVQTMFLNGKAAMMYTGSWLANEMKGVGGVEKFPMMKTPVISAILDKLETVKTETELRNLISAIDSVTDGEKALSDFAEGENYKVDGKVVSSADWKYVSAARNTVGINYSHASMFIPNYSNAIDGAKEFMKYFYSDEGYRIYMDTLHLGLPLSLSEGKPDQSEWSDFELSQYQLLTSSEYLVTQYIANRHRIFIDGGADAYAGYEFIAPLCATNSKDRKTADDIWKHVGTLIDDEYEDSWLANIKK